MRAVVLANNLFPIFFDNGSSVHLWSLCDGLFQAGFEVHFVSYHFDEQYWKKLPGDLYQTAGANFIFHSLPIKNNYKPINDNTNLPRRLIFPKTSDFYLGYQYSTTIESLLKEIAPDLIFAWTADAVAASSGYKLKKSIGLITDMDFLALKYRHQYTYRQRTPRSFVLKAIKLLLDKNLSRLYPDLLKECDCIVCHANHHAQWLKEKGIDRIKYFPIAVLDRAGALNWNNKKTAIYRNSKPIISIIGNVNGIATLSGLYFLRDEMLASLSKLAQEIDFELHLVGGGKLPSDLERSFNRPWIKKLGWVQDVTEKFYSSTVLLVPIPIPLGFRTRIAEAFSYGTCVVAHTNNALGMPELKNNQNILLSDRGEELTRMIGDCLVNPEKVHKIGMGARETYEKDYEGSKIIRNVLKYCHG